MAKNRLTDPDNVLFVVWGAVTIIWLVVLLPLQLTDHFSYLAFYVSLFVTIVILAFTWNEPWRKD